MSVPLDHLTLHKTELPPSDRSDSWDEFPAYADAVVGLIGGRLGQRIDSGGERVWKFDRKGLDSWLTWDHLDPGVSIEPCNKDAGAGIEAIRDVLLRARPDSSA